MATALFSSLSRSLACLFLSHCCFFLLLEFPILVLYIVFLASFAVFSRCCISRFIIITLILSQFPLRLYYFLVVYCLILIASYVLFSKIATLLPVLFLLLFYHIISRFPFLVLSIVFRSLFFSFSFCWSLPLSSPFLL